MAEAKQVIYCDYCFEEGQTINATAFCGKCGKYLCGSCVKQHGKFLPSHKLSSGSRIPNKEKATACMPCQIHSDQIVELFCEGHKDVFCKLCKFVKHSNCAVKYIKEAVKDIDVKSEFEARVADLLKLQGLMKEKQRENKHKLYTYSKNKNEMKSTAKSLRKQLNEIFDTYEEQLNTGEQVSLEKLSLKVQSYTSFLSQLESQLKAQKANEHKTTDEGLLLSVAEMIRLYGRYKEQVDTLEHEVANPESLALKDQRVPSVIQGLIQISCVEEEDSVAGGAETKTIANCHNVMKDQSCQTDSMSQDDSEAKLERVCSFCNSQIGLHSSKKQTESPLANIDDTEHGSSDDVAEHSMINYPKVSFSDIKSCSLLNQTTLDNDITFTDFCCMPDGQAVLCTSNGLRILDTDMKEKVRLDPQKSDHSPNAIDIMDSKNVVVFVPEAKILQIFSIIPTVKLGREIGLKCKCTGLKCHNNKFFIYSVNLYESSCFKYPGIQALDSNWEVLKTIPIFDDLERFCITRNGHIVYSYTSQSKRQIKCITQDNTDIFSYPVSGDMKTFIPDDDGNVIICDTNSKTVSFVKSDGTPGKILFEEKDSNDRCNKRFGSMYYNRHNNTILVLTYERQYDTSRRCYQRIAIYMRVYKIEM